MSTSDDDRAELARLRAENEALRQQSQRGPYLKVSEKGGVSLYGLGRFPVTLYVEQWEKLLEMSPQVRQFILDHGPELKRKRLL